MDYKYHSGFFIEYDLKELSEYYPNVSRKCQTISYLGREGRRYPCLYFHLCSRGVDRIVSLENNGICISLGWI